MLLRRPAWIRVWAGAYISILPVPRPGIAASYSVSRSHRLVCRKWTGSTGGRAIHGVLQLLLYGAHLLLLCFQQNVPYFLVFIIWAVIVATFAAVRRRVESDLIEARDHLKAEEQRFRDYAEVASDWLWETGPDHRFTHFSQSGSNWKFLQEFIGTKRWDGAADREEEPEKWLAHMAILEAHQPFRGFRYRVLLPGGSETCLSVSGKPVFNARGEFMGHRGVATDVNAEVRAGEAERALQEAQAELAHVSRVTTLGEIAASLSHELGQPITAAYNNANAALQFLDGERPDLAEVREAVGCVVDDATRAADIIDRIRDQIKKAPPRKVNFDINAAITEVIALARREWIKNEILVETRLAEQLSLVWGDRVQLQQVILNLTFNAVEAMKSVSDRPRELSISTEQSNADGVLVVVRDSGHGIDSQKS